MSSADFEGIGRDEELLHAYHDGELTVLQHWWFERRLRGSSRLRAQLRELRKLTALTRASDGCQPSVDLWDRIALRLPALDAQRAESGERPGAAWALPAGYFRPLVAVGVTAALALALFLGTIEDAIQATPGMIRWLDTGGRSVMVLEQEAGTTIVWLLDSPQEGASVRGSREAV